MPPIKRKLVPKGWTAEQETPIHLTPDGIARMKAELERLRHNLPALAAEAGRTAAFGDRSENAEYQAAKRDLRRTKGRILRLTAILKHAMPLPTGPARDGRVQLGSTVTLAPCDERCAATNGGSQKTYRLVTPSEANPTRGRISMQSPLGKAAIGKRRNDIIAITTPRGTQTYRIIDIS